VFQGATAFNQDIGRWITGSVTTTEGSNAIDTRVESA
jgi:surface protein